MNAPHIPVRMIMQACLTRQAMAACCVHRQLDACLDHIQHTQPKQSGSKMQASQPFTTAAPHAPVSLGLVLYPDLPGQGS